MANADKQNFYFKLTKLMPFFFVVNFCCLDIQIDRKFLRLDVSTNVEDQPALHLITKNLGFQLWSSWSGFIPKSTN